VRYIYIFLILLIVLNARENPFMPIKDIKKEKNITNSAKFKRAKFNKAFGLQLFRWLSIEIIDNKIKLNTKDRLKRSFTVKNPKKLVLDFESKKSFQTKKIANLKNAFISEIAIGSHKKYYRIAITLKKSAKFKIEKKDYGYKIIFY